MKLDDDLVSAIVHITKSAAWHTGYNSVTRAKTMRQVVGLILENGNGKESLFSFAYWDTKNLANNQRHYYFLQDLQEIGLKKARAVTKHNANLIQGKRSGVN